MVYRIKSARRHGYAAGTFRNLIPSVPICSDKSPLQVMLDCAPAGVKWSNVEMAPTEARGTYRALGTDSAGYREATYYVDIVVCAAI